MRRWRLRISWLSPAALLLFVSTVAVPRAALVVHSHAGGEHAHSHGDELDAISHQHEHAYHHEHLHTHPHGLAFEDDDDDHGSLHSHWQHPFHNVTPGAASVLVVARRVESLEHEPRHDPVYEFGLSHHARGPPRPA